MDIVVSETQATTVITENGDTVVTTADATQVIGVQEQSMVVATATATDVVDVAGDTVLSAEASVVVVTEGKQGPQGVPGTAPGIQLEMGESLAKGTPVYVAANKLYAADSVTNFRVVGVLDADYALGLLGTAVAFGTIGGMLGLTPNTPYYLGNRAIASSVPASGYVVKIGQALTVDSLLVNVEEPILLH